MTRQSIREYAAAGKAEKGGLLDEFCRVTGYHRTVAMRLLRAEPQRVRRGGGRPRSYGPAVQQALVTTWEAGDRPCGKRLAPSWRRSCRP